MRCSWSRGAPFLVGGRPVDAQGVARPAFEWSMLNGKSVKKTIKQQEKEDKLDPNVLRVPKPNSDKGWQFRKDIAWAIGNLDLIKKKFLGFDEKG